MLLSSSIPCLSRHGLRHGLATSLLAHHSMCQGAHVSGTASSPPSDVAMASGWAGMTSTRRHYTSFSSAHANKPSAATGPVSFYKRLQVSVDATSEEIKVAYRARALECHPDVVDAANKGFAEVAFRGVSEAYETLSDPHKRRLHDESLGISRGKQQGEEEDLRRAASQGASRPARKRRSAGYAGYQASSSPSSSGKPSGSAGTFSSASAAAWKKPYVRGDADRTFADAFEGKSLDQILFEARRRKRMEAAAAAAGASVRAHQQERQQQQQQQGGGAGLATGERAAGHGESVRRAMEHAAERYAERLQKQFGHGVLRSVRAGTGVAAAGGFRVPGGPLPAGPQAPPSSRLPFRPFVNQPLPEGVTAPADPVVEPVGTALDANVAPVTQAELFEAEETRFLAAHPNYAPGGVDEKVYQQEREDLRRGFRRHPRYFHEHRLKDGTRLSPLESLRRAETGIAGAAHNMGQLYSYQRPY